MIILNILGYLCRNKQNSYAVLITFVNKTMIKKLFYIVRQILKSPKDI